MTASEDRPQTAPAPPHPGGVLARLSVDLAQILRFYARLPVPRLPFEHDPYAPPDIGGAIWAVPVAGGIIGACGAAIGAGGLWLTQAPVIGAVLTIAALVIVTGCFHEDGLADSADGLWGGATMERRLEIMRDSRIGAYGGAALILSLVLRIAALSEIYRALGIKGAWVVIGIAALSRFIGLLPLRLAPSARPDSFSRTIGTGPALARHAALLLGLGGFVLAALAAMPPGKPVLVASIAAGLITLLLPRGIAALGRAKIGGITGDLLGATQQLSEMALLVVLVSCLAHS